MKKMLSVILCVLMLAGMCACGDSNSNQASQTPVSPDNSSSEIEEISFSLGDVSGTGTFLEQNAQFFSQKVSELSGGKMKVEIFSDGLLGTHDEHPDWCLGDGELLVYIHKSCKECRHLRLPIPDNRSRPDRVA